MSAFRVKRIHLKCKFGHEIKLLVKSYRRQLLATAISDMVSATSDRCYAIWAHERTDINTLEIAHLYSKLKKRAKKEEVHIRVLQ